MNILLVGAGYVGMSLLSVLAKGNFVHVVDTDERKVAELCNGKVSLVDPLAEDYFKSNSLSFKASSAYPDDIGFECVVLCLPTDYSEKSKSFDTSILDECLDKVVSLYKNAFIVIKSTVPSGYTQRKQNEYTDRVILFSPEFLRESFSLSDNLHPSRIVVGHDGHEKEAERFALLLKEAALEEAPILLTSLEEAEAIKLFSNAYLALRISFFNELDSYALRKGLNTKSIIDGVCLDPRIGNHYNNPSFGYGGYCLPKDTKQLASNYGDIPQDLISAVIDANATRKQVIADKAIELAHGKKIGIYRLAMKKGSDNFRFSSTIDVLQLLGDEDVVIYEPALKEPSYLGRPLEKDLKKFLSDCDLILANRMDPELEAVKNKLLTRDLFHKE